MALTIASVVFAAHRMAKTFDNVLEASATNYLFLFTQRTITLRNEPPTPPPLNALGLPCNGVYLLWKWVQNQEQKPRPIEPKDSLSLRGKGNLRGRSPYSETLAQKIKPLAEKIAEYISTHQEDTAQEDRWRTTMKRETMKRFREQRQAIAEVRGAIDEHQEKLAEVHRLIVKLANGNAVRPLPLAASFTIPPIGRTTR